mgnify:CR=1 FL=1
MNSLFPRTSFPGPTDQDSLGELCLANASLVLPDQVVTGSLTIEQGKISEI